MAHLSMFAARSSVAALFFISAFIGGCAVKFVAQLTGKWVQLTNSIAGGVLIGVALCHMLAESIEDLDGWGKDVNRSLGGESDEAFPLGFLFCGLGFFLVVGLEHLLGGHDHGSEHSHDHATAVCEGRSEDSESTQESTEARAVEIADQVEQNGSHVVPPEEMVIFARKTNTKLGGAGTFVGITIHSLIEGVAVGSVPEVDGVLVLMGAILPHKFLAAFAVGSALNSIGDTALWWILVVAMAASGPIGIIAGAITASSLDGPGAAMLQCVAAGTLLAVGIIELLMPALVDKTVWRRRKLVAAILSFCAMALIAAWA